MTEIDRALTNRRLGARARRNRPAGRWLRQHNTGATAMRVSLHARDGTGWLTMQSAAN